MSDTRNVDNAQNLLADDLLRVILKAVDQSTDGIIVTTPEIDPPGPQIIYANPAFCRITGYSADAVLGKTPRILQGPKSDRAVLDRVRMTLERREPFFGEIINYRQEGTEFWMEWHIAPVFDEHGQLRNWIAIQRDITETKRVRDELDSANARLQREVAERMKAEEIRQASHDLLKQLFRIQQAERKLMAYEIHDGIIQYATGGDLHLEAFLTRHQGEAVVEDVEVARIQLQRIIREGRQLMNDLRPPLLDEMGVVAAIEHLIHEERMGEVSIRFDHGTEFGRLLPSLENAIYRIVQEAVTNSRKHSQSDRVEIRLRYDAATVRVEIEDWGVGFDPDAVTSGNHGLQGIRERVKLFGGTALIASRPGQSTLVTAILPLLAPIPDPQEQWTD